MLERDRNFYRNIVLGIKTETQVEFETQIEPITDYQPVHRGRTVSSKRAAAENFYKDRAAKLGAVPATVNELTEAERRFNESLSDFKGH